MPLTPEEYHKGLLKAMQYCARQERCHKEVRGKLLDWEIYGDELESIIGELISQNFLNEERFAQAYARGKFRMKRWGKVRILKELKFRQISAYCIKKGMAEIDDGEYLSTLDYVLLKKAKMPLEELDYAQKGKVAKYAINRGFESELVWNALS